MPTAARPSNEVLRQMLVSGGIVTQAQVDEALRRIRGDDRRLAGVLLEMGVVDEDEAQSIMAMQFGAPYIDLADYILDPEEVRLIPREFATRYNAIAVARKGPQLLVAMADPFDLPVRDRLRQITGCSIRTLFTDKELIQAAIHKYYSMDSKIEDLAANLAQTTVIAAPDDDALDASDLDTKVPAVELVNMIVLKALKMRASDIHLEPAKTSLCLRFRVDGVLGDISSFSKMVQPAIISRIKVLAHMNIAEKRVPQDGRFNIKIRDAEADVRVSTVPTIHGEKVVMRLLGRATQAPELETLGMSPGTRAALERVVFKPFGLILVTGPTGSGKTTTLYSILRRLATQEINIVTIEDPVEIQLERVNQIQVNPQAGLTFVSALRSVLRQDPDIIMVGEIRDSETADLAIRAALTGHLVLSTVHTNDAAGAVTRLVDMGIEPFLLGSSLLAVMAQRLVRVVCPTCKVEETPNQQPFEVLGIEPARRPHKVLVGRGCVGCHSKGFSGRTGVFEVMLPDDELRSLIMARADVGRLRRHAIDGGMVSMLEDGFIKICSGITTPEELMRAVY